MSRDGNSGIIRKKGTPSVSYDVIILYTIPVYAVFGFLCRVLNGKERREGEP
jgi:hypothetical protein